MKSLRSGNNRQACPPAEDSQPGAEAATLPFQLACLLTRSRYKVVYIGVGSAKSWSVARALLLRGAQEPLRILCAREFQNSLSESSHRLLADQVVELGLSDFYRSEEHTSDLQ